jgi:exopolyphosphatase / guanosine-5'-triphosphate,3'-diphosphate pyrophosphatase
MADLEGPAAAALRAGHRAPKGNWSPRRTYAALDLGTNNCRLLIARPAGEDGFVIVDAFSRIVRLGEGLAASGRLSDAAIERAVAALSICADKLVKRGVHLSRAVATEACRRAENGREFVDRVYRETGIALEIIDPGEEARLAVQGCHALLEPGGGPSLIFDIGGGSTELVELLPEGPVPGGPPQIADWISVPWGVVSLAESEPQGVGSRDDRIATYARMKARVAEALGVLHLPEGELRLLGTSGTVTTLASVFLDLPSYDRRAVDGLHVPVEDMRRIGRELAAMSIAERAQVACIGSERADLVVAGCAILEAILDLWPAPRVGVADRGIREGILRSLMAGTVR